ncbi:hypothetical protein [Pikeienuella sp. HZG-20]|uniref:hypothetical protein n=1 Tax=Paludibacillus litoralis TaxID=3133267 RepID=UPI0030EC06AB
MNDEWRAAVQHLGRRPHQIVDVDFENDHHAQEIDGVKMSASVHHIRKVSLREAAFISEARHPDSSRRA